MKSGVMSVDAGCIPPPGCTLADAAGRARWVCTDPATPVLQDFIALHHGIKFLMFDHDVLDMATLHVQACLPDSRRPATNDPRQQAAQLKRTGIVASWCAPVRCDCGESCRGCPFLQLSMHGSREAHRWYHLLTPGIWRQSVVPAHGAPHNACHTPWYKSCCGLLRFWAWGTHHADVPSVVKPLHQRDAVMTPAGVVALQCVQHLQLQAGHGGRR